MSSSARRNSDPARDLSYAIDLINSGGTQTEAASRIAVVAGVSAWSGQFFLVAKLLIDTVDEIDAALLGHEGLDDEDRGQIQGDLMRLRAAFSRESLSGNWTNLTLQGAPLGPETRVFLQGASRQIRSTRAYYSPNTEDISVIRNAIEAIRNDVIEVRLEGVDFAREAILRGANEVSFILERIELFGFSRLENPVMELGAFLFTISAELKQNGQSTDQIKRSMSALSNAYSRMKELAKAHGVAKLAYEGSHWLITHLK